MLRVFRFYWTQEYGDGVMLIAATDKNRAQVLCKEEGLSYDFDYEMINLKWEGDEGVILENHYQE